MRCCCRWQVGFRCCPTGGLGPTQGGSIRSCPSKCKGNAVTLWSLGTRCGSRCSGWSVLMPAGVTNAPTSVLHRMLGLPYTEPGFATIERVVGAAGSGTGAAGCGGGGGPAAVPASAAPSSRWRSEVGCRNVPLAEARAVEAPCQPAT